MVSLKANRKTARPHSVEDPGVKARSYKTKAKDLASEAKAKDLALKAKAKDLTIKAKDLACNAKDIFSAYQSETETGRSSSNHTNS